MSNESLVMMMKRNMRIPLILIPLSLAFGWIISMFNPAKQVPPVYVQSAYVDFGGLKQIEQTNGDIMFLLRTDDAIRIMQTQLSGQDLGGGASLRFVGTQEGGSSTRIYIDIQSPQSTISPEVFTKVLEPIQSDVNRTLQNSFRLLDFQKANHDDYLKKIAESFQNAAKRSPGADAVTQAAIGILVRGISGSGVDHAELRLNNIQRVRELLTEFGQLKLEFIGPPKLIEASYAEKRVAWTLKIAFTIGLVISGLWIFLAEARRRTQH